MSEPLHVAFIWHMHQPYYRSAVSGAFDMPWARMHALKDYADMVKALAPYPSLHHTFNLVPSLVEQLEVYASGHFSDVYWDHTLKSAADLDESERAFVVERMCERPDHPRARAFPRYLELARKRESCCSLGWVECAATFSVPELRDLQVWFNLAWFDPLSLETEPLSNLVRQGRDFQEEDKLILAEAQRAALSATLPTYREAARRGQVELTTSPYFHPILPLLCNTDSARLGCPDTLLPPRRFAHAEDAQEQVGLALDKHARVFGEVPAGMWCSEQAVGEDVLQVLMQAGIRWTVSDETVLSRSLGGAAPVDLVSRAQTVSPRDLPVAAAARPLRPSDLYRPYNLEREGKQLSIVFRDHTLSDLVGFAYQSWDSRDAAHDLLRRLREIRDSPDLRRSEPSEGAALVTIALDGENAWEYYPRDGRDFLNYLYEGLSRDESLRCVTISEHLAENPPSRSLGWLHTGSWIGGDLRTWSGDRGHNVAWELLHRARDLAAERRRAAAGVAAGAAASGAQAVSTPAASRAETDEPAGSQSSVTGPDVESVWRHILVAEGSDWYWWFGNHHHTELDYVWDLNFRLHLQAVYRTLGEPLPLELFFPVLGEAPSMGPAAPIGAVAPTIDGFIAPADEWNNAGHLEPDTFSTMQPSETTRIVEARLGWMDTSLCVLLGPAEGAGLEGLDVELRLTRAGMPDDPVLHLSLRQPGEVAVRFAESARLAGTPEVAWHDVLEVRLPFGPEELVTASTTGLVVRVGRQGLTERLFHSNSLTKA